MFLIFFVIIGIIIKIVFLLVSVAFYTLVERKLQASIQRRKGPNIAGFWGLLQPFADGLKLFFKENIIPFKADAFLFIFSPAWVFGLSLLFFYILPLVLPKLGEISLAANLFFFYMISSLNVYGIILGGWSSNSKYAFLGSLRSAAQMISYEVGIGFVFLMLILFSGSFEITIVEKAQENIWNFFSLFPLFLIFLVSMLAETNRAPFDLVEAEAEIVAGYNVEYSAMPFALYFLGEYTNMYVMSNLLIIFFLGGSLSFFFFDSIVKTLVFAAFMIIVRAAYPRVRYDQLMGLGWRWFVPFILFYFMFMLILYSFV